MSVGIGAILFLVSMGYGLQRTILEKITTEDSLLTVDVSKQKESASVLDRETLEKIKNIDGVSEISPTFRLTSQGRLEELKADLEVIAADAAFFRLSGMRLEKGENLSNDKKEGIVISSAISKIFSKEAKDMIGKEMTFTFIVPENGAGQIGGENQANEGRKVESDTKYKIVGTVESEENIIYVNYASLGNLGLSYFDQVKVKCKSDKKMAEIKGDISSRGFTVSSISETVDQANKVFGVIKLVLMLFGIIALVVSAIGMFNTMTITLLERTEEIGIMKSIGASDMTISLIFIMESTIMGFLGGVVGIVIGWLEGELFNTAVNFIATRFGGEKVDLFYSPLWFILATIIFAAVVGFITGVIPAKRASKIDPLDALRYK